MLRLPVWRVRPMVVLLLRGMSVVRITQPAPYRGLMLGALAVAGVGGAALALVAGRVAGTALLVTVTLAILSGVQGLRTT